MDMFSKLGFGDLLMSWDFREASDERLPVFNF
jgi:hypothetical protein